MTHASTLVLGLAGAALAAAGIWLWARYGEAVFAEALLAGLTGCFG